MKKKISFFYVKIDIIFLYINKNKFTFKKISLAIIIFAIINKNLKIYSQN